MKAAGWGECKVCLGDLVPIRAKGQLVAVKCSGRCQVRIQLPKEETRHRQVDWERVKRSTTSDRIHNQR